MGIPRLTQDIAPSAETAILGETPPGISAIEIRNLIIDGPSLVYHVYNALLRSRGSLCEDFNSLPSYKQINACFVQFLEDVSANGVHVDKLIFDGALPTSKRPVRLERLEKTRQNLESYRKVHGHYGFHGKPIAANSYSSLDCVDNDYLRAALWNDHTVSLAALHLLPPPPFMVASVIERLQRSSWSSITYIVPGEADAYCAGEASSRDATILSNDADLVLYNLHSKSRVMVLRTLQVLEQGGDSRNILIRGNCLRPQKIARDLNVPKLLAFGYHRLKDPSATTTFIAQQARQGVPVESDAAWINFQDEYRSASLDELASTEKTTKLLLSIQSADPRVAELICSLANGQNPQMYLATVLEDSSRDCSWTYGLELRQLAYSLLLHNHNAQKNEITCNSVTEYSRKGSRVTSAQVPILHRTALIDKIKTTCDKIGYYHDNPSTYNGNTVKLASIANSVLNWHLVAASIVISQRLSKCKQYQPAFSRLFLPNSGKIYDSQATTWDDIHFYAAVQCTLYSLRIVKQIVAQVVRDVSIPQNDQLRTSAEDVSRFLAYMPCIDDLFPQLIHFRSILLGLPPKYVTERVTRLLEQADPTSTALAQTLSATTRGAEVSAVVRKEAKKKDEHTWQNADTKKKKKPRPRKRENNVAYTDGAVKGSRQKVLHINQHGPGSANAFAALQNDANTPGGPD